MPLNSTRGASSAKGFGFTSGGVKPIDFDYLVVAGGGAGNQGLGGGGGAGGMRSSFPGGTKITVNSKITTVTVGAGGVGLNPQDSNPAGLIAGHGQDSSIGTFITSTGGGAYNDSGAYGPPNTSPQNASVRNGGSGSGQTHQQQTITGLGNTPPTSPSQGNPGGPGGGSFGASGGGGAGGAGNNGEGSSPNPSNSGPGGPGVNNSISGSSVTYAGGGGGGGYVQAAGSGGPGGGGAGGAHSSNGTAGSTNTGGGGGAPGPGGTSGTSGGSGIIYLRVPTANAPASLSVSPGTNTITTDGSDKVLTFTVSGTLTI